MAAIKGRGAPANSLSDRFNLPLRQVDGDWLDMAEALDEALPPPRTSIMVERPRTIITRNASPDIPFDRSLNAYRGCDQPYTVA